MMILWRPGGSVTFFFAKSFILLRTTSMPRASEAFSSSTAFSYASPSISRARHRILRAQRKEPVGERIISKT